MDAPQSPTATTMSTTAAHRWRFKLRTLLLMIAAVSVGLAALKYATAAWSCAIASATLLGMLAAAVMAVCGSREHRAFWSGFVIFGGGYFAFFTLAIGPNFGVDAVPVSRVIYTYSGAPVVETSEERREDTRQFASHLATTRVVNWLYREFLPQAAASPVPIASWTAPLSPPASYPASTPTTSVPYTPAPTPPTLQSPTQAVPTLAPVPESPTPAPMAAPEPTTVLVPHPAASDYDSTQGVRQAAAQAASSDNGPTPAAAKPIPDYPQQAPPQVATPVLSPSPAGYSPPPVYPTALTVVASWDTPQRFAYFTVIGHCLWAWILGGVGGLFARWAYSRAHLATC